MSEAGVAIRDLISMHARKDVLSRSPFPAACMMPDTSTSTNTSTHTSPTIHALVQRPWIYASTSLITFGELATHSACHTYHIPASALTLSAMALVIRPACSGDRGTISDSKGLGQLYWVMSARAMLSQIEQFTYLVISPVHSGCGAIGFPVLGSTFCRISKEDRIIDIPIHNAD